MALPMLFKLFIPLFWVSWTDNREGDILVKYIAPPTLAWFRSSIELKILKNDRLS